MGQTFHGIEITLQLLSVRKVKEGTKYGWTEVPAKSG
jgi:hypothetical protein